MAVLLECVDRQQRAVVLTHDTWHKHVLPQRPMLEGLEHCIPLVLRDPFRVCRDANHPNRECFYRPRIIPYRPHLYLKVVVEYTLADPEAGSQSVGEVVTVIPVRRFTPGEQQLWPR